VARLTPVDFDPFAQAPTSEARLEPVDFDPFNGAQGRPGAEPTALAPASGPFPAVTAPQAGPQTATPQPQSSTPVSAPPPYTPPVRLPGDPDPGILEESYGDIIKGGHATKRGVFLTSYMLNAYDDVDNISQHLAASQEIENQYPSSSSTRKAAEKLETQKSEGAGGILPALGVYATHPRAAISAAVQSLPSMLASLVTVPVGAVGGGVVAGPPGAVGGAIAGLGVGSAAADFGSAFEDYARDKWKPQNAAEWKAILLDPEKTREAGNYAAIHAGMVGAFEAFGGKLGGKVGTAIAGRVAERGFGKVTQIGAAAVPAITTDATVGAVGEAAGQLAGAGEIRDPAGVAGEFAAGLVTGGATSSIEPVVKALNVGAEKQTPVAPADVAAAGQAVRDVETTTPVLDPVPTPEMLAGSIRMTPDTDTWYSPTRRFIEEKGPGSATPAQWEATLRNSPTAKMEEVQDTGLLDFIAGQEGGKVSRRDVLDYLDEHAIRLEVTERNNRDQTPEASSTNPPGWGSVGGGPDARYEEYTLPGDRDDYFELTMHMPTRNVGAVEGEMGWVPEGSPDNVQRDFVGGHYAEPNIIAHARVTARRSLDGQPMALIEEIQSDWHQAGRRHGYRTPQHDVAITQYQQEIDNASSLWRRAEIAYNEAVRLHGTASSQARALSEQVKQAEDQWDAADIRWREALQGVQEMAVGGPFRQSWDELAFKRLLRWAADRGFKRIAWVNAAEQTRRYPGSAKRDAGMVQFYDKRIPSIAKKWAKRLGGTYGTTTSGEQIIASVEPAEGNGFIIVDQNGNTITEAGYHATVVSAQIAADRATNARLQNSVQYIDIPQAGIDAIQRGLPMYSGYMESRKQRNKKPGATLDELADVRVTQFAQSFGPALNELAKAFGVRTRLKFHDGGKPGEGMIVVKRPDGSNERLQALGMYEGSTGIIHINMKAHATAQEVWATITHEFGHAVMYHVYTTASTAVRTAVRAAYDEYKANTPASQNYNRAVWMRDNAVVAYHNTRRANPGSPVRVGDLSPQQREYWTGFDEWFAEQVARWATTNRRPLALVEKFFAGLAKKLIEVFKQASAKFGLDFNPSKAMDSWLTSFVTDMQPFGENVDITTKVETTEDNQRHTGPEEKAVEMQPETVVAREGVDGLFKGRPPKEIQETLAYADKFNKIYKWMLGIHQVAQRNTHILPLQEYTETISVAQLVKQQIMIRAQGVLKNWNKLGQKQGDAVAALIDDVQNLVYLTPDEVKKKVSRFPTNAELQTLVAKHQVSKQGLAVFKEVADTFNEHLTRYEAVLRNEAAKITDPVARIKAEDGITLQIKALRSKPYFPAMRFGDFTITVKNAAGVVIHFETFERERTRNAAADAIRAQYGVTKDNMELGKLDRAARPLLGVPTQLLDMMAKKLTLTKAQRDALEQLKFELSPAQSFKHRFQHKRRIAGYSQDFRRAYAGYFFHGANHLMKAMYADRLRGLRDQTQEETKGVYDVTTRHEITAFMTDHLENWLDPKSDWAAIRSIAFLWALAFSPAAAAQNLTQTLMTTYPFLANQFGDLKAVGALARVGADFQTFYKRGTLEKTTDVELRAIGRGVQDGLITEAMAPELAGYAENNTLGRWHGTEIQAHLMKFNEWGAKLFELAEQVNRRLVFRAAYKLATENPNVQYVKEMPVKHKLHYDQLRKEGWTEQEATAYVVARDAVVTTQFQYGREYAPRFMRGKARSIFVFKTFIQSYVVFLANYPQAAIRSVLILGFLGGLMGIPGAEDLKEILRALGYRLFGKDFDLEKEARRWMLELVGKDENGRDVADIVLNGIARRGFGIPAFMDMLGGTVGVDVPMPTFDRSRAISAGTLLPVELGKLFGPPLQNPDEVISAQAQKASGAVFGAGFNIYKALTNSKLSWQDSKRWEKAVPRSLGSLAHAYRVGREGRERTNTGSTLVQYDVRDTEQLMEVLGIAAGYSPFRTSLQWDRVMAGRDAVKLWDIRREGLMKQMGNAVMGKDEKEQERVKGAIREFNSGLPDHARGKAITSDVLRQSIGTQARSRAAREAESSVRRSDIPILEEVQKLYPDSRAVSVRKVPGSRQ
jgi:hypothetical protein